MSAVAPRPSAAARWIGGGCPGSVRLEAQYPEGTSPAAEKGTRLHGLAATALTGGPRAYNQEDAEVIDPYIENVQQEVARRPKAKLLVEQEAWWKRLPRLRGTPDAVLIDWTNKHLIIWDLKTGWRVVEAIWNWQLICYCLMHAREGWTHDLRIVQTLPYHPDGPVRSWSPTWEVLKSCGQRVFDAVEAVLSPDPVLRPGSHCLYCDALAGCVAAREVTLSAIERVAGEPIQLPASHVRKELSVLRETLKLLELRVEALEEETATRLRAGENIPGVYMRENRRGKRVKWNDDEDKIRFALKVLMGKDPAVPKLPTPTQMKNNGVPEELLQPFTRVQPGKMQVSTEADRLAKQIFGNEPNMEHTK